MANCPVGWFNLASGIVLLPASIVFGWFYETAGATVACEFSAGCARGSTILLFRIKPIAD